jgi:hypothetical protein
MAAERSVLPSRTDLTWQRELVDHYSFGIGSSSLVLDASDSPLITYVRDAVQVPLARKIGGTWHIEPVDGGDFGAALALSSNGLPRISYQRASTVRISMRIGAGWVSRRLDDATNGSFTSVAVAPGGGVGVSYEGSDQILRFALISPKTTTIEMVNAPFLGGYPSVVFDAAGSPHIVFLNLSTVSAEYAYRTPGGSWIITPLEGCSFVGAGHSLALDSTGRAHIVCLGSDGVTYVSEQPDGTFQSEPIDGLSYASGMSLALDAQDAPHVAITDNTQIEYAAKVGSSWQIELVDPPSGSFSNQQPWIVLDSQELPHLSYTKCELVNEMCVSWSVVYASRTP